MPFIEENQINKEIIKYNTQKCLICSKKYLKIDFRKCTKCENEYCLKCSILGGKLGIFCKNCFKKLPVKEMEKVSKNAMKLKFWAKNGYYIFLFFLIIAIGSISLSYISMMFFFLGLLFIIINLIYGSLLFKYLNEK